MKKTALYSSKTECSGCGACENSCPKGIIEMVYDNEGFLYPNIIDKEACVGCNICEEVCPVKHSGEIESNFTKAYAGWRTDGRQVKSASGGMAQTLSEYIISLGGTVYGVKYADDWKSAEYVRGTDSEDIKLMRSSKYIQASKGCIYKEIKKDLDSDIPVLFIGLPCDTFAVWKYLETSGCDKNPILVSLICHGPTSQSVHTSFVEQIETENNTKICGIDVRYKKNGKWKPYYIHAEFENGKKYLKKFESTDYDVAFANFKRPSCTDCRFKNNNFCADLLIGDFHSAMKGTDEYNPSGVSTVLPLTKKGQEILEIVGEEKFRLFDTDLNRSISQKAIHSSVTSDINRTAFADELHKNGLKAACRNPDILAKKRKKKTISP